MRTTTKLLGAAWAVLLLGVVACGDDSEPGDGNPGTGGSSSSGGNGTSGGSSSGGAATGGAATGGGSAGGASTGGGGGSGGNGPKGTPHVFVGSTDGFVRVYTMDESDGALVDAGAHDTGDGLDFVNVGPDNRTVFVSDDGSVSAFTYDPTAKTLTLIDSATTFGGGTHVEVDPTGEFVFVAHYNQGKMTFLPFSQQGGFGTGQEFSPGANAHQVRVDASGTHVYVPCLGSDHVAQYILDPTAGSLTAAAPATAAAGNGPRHMDFHPTAPVAYVVNELEPSAVQVMDIAQDGTLTRRVSDQVFMSPDEGFHQASDIQVTPDGKFVYAVNRQPSEVVGFRVEADHSLTRLDAESLPGVVRAFGMDPKGEYLQMGTNNGHMVALRIDGDTGALTRTSDETGLGPINATLVRYLEP